MAYQLHSRAIGAFGEVFKTEAEAEAHRQKLIEVADSIRPDIAKKRGEFPANPREFFKVIPVTTNDNKVGDNE